MGLKTLRALQRRLMPRDEIYLHLKACIKPAVSVQFRKITSSFRQTPGVAASMIQEQLAFIMSNTCMAGSHYFFCFAPHHRITILGRTQAPLSELVLFIWQLVIRAVQRRRVGRQRRRARGTPQTCLHRSRQRRPSPGRIDRRVNRWGASDRKTSPAWEGPRRGILSTRLVSSLTLRRQIRALALAWFSLYRRARIMDENRTVGSQNGGISRLGSGWRSSGSHVHRQPIGVWCARFDGLEFAEVAIPLLTPKLWTSYDRTPPSGGVLTSSFSP